MKLISAQYPLPQELSNAYPPDEAAGLLGQAFERRENIDGLNQLRRDQLINFDSEAMDRVESGEWLLVKGNAYAFDWGQFDKPVRKQMFDQRVQELLRAPPVQSPTKVRYGQVFRVLNSETRMPVPLRVYSAIVDGNKINGKTDFYGLIQIFAFSERSRISVHVAYEAPVGNVDGLMSDEDCELSVTESKVRILGYDVPPIEILVNDRAMVRKFIIDGVASSGFSFKERSEWGGVSQAVGHSYDWDYSMVALHHAGRSRGCGGIGAIQMKRILKDHLIKDNDIGYHFGIDCAGEVFEGRDIRFKGSHLELFNSRVVGVVMLHDLTVPGEVSDKYEFARGMMEPWTKVEGPAPDLQVKALMALLNALRKTFNIEIFGGHREFPKQVKEGKICPGNNGIEVVNEIRRTTGLRSPAK